MKKSIKIVTFLLIAVGALQFWRPEEIQYGTPAKDLSNVPQEINNILRNSCFDCHSSQANLSWYDKIAPASFIVSSHIRAGRKVLNFSKWDSLKKPQQNATLYYALNKILSGEMPLPSYTAIHPASKINEASISALKNYVTALAPRNGTISTQTLNNNIQHKNHPGKVLPSPNGIRYIPDYRSWKAISTSDRFDNGTMRIIFGNDIAVKAIKEHQTNPWPDGAIFAKTAWKQKTEPDGTISPGDFVQVEYMIKDAKKFAATKGWGWARWKGNDLKPYGVLPKFEQECISCHNPVKDNDYVFTTPLHLNVNKYNSYSKN